MFSLSVLVATTAIDARPVVTIPGVGVAEGVYDPICAAGTGVELFLGLPYAQPPVGPLRWRDPAPLTAWPSGTRDASSFGARCMQSDAIPVPNSTMSEDCLYLNVAAPKGAAAAAAADPSSANRAVMLWIHGGSYTTGESNDYPGNALVAASNGTACTVGAPLPAAVPPPLTAALRSPDVVVVTINYRLNVFGFLGAGELAAEAGAAGTGNYGIADQRAAMAWVQTHIHAFGGDGSDITVFGESAGGNSVLNHLAQKASFPYYRRAIIESGAYDRGAATMVDAEAQFASILNLAHCTHGHSTGLECLRALDAEKLRDVAIAQGALLPKDRGWGPVVDGVALSKTPLDLILDGDYNAKVPVLSGTNRDEMAYFFIVFGVDPGIDTAAMEALLPAYGLTANATDMAALRQLFAIDGSGGAYEYPPKARRGNYSDAWWVGMRMLTDSIPALGPCSNRRLSRALLAGGTPAVYNYFFVHPTQSSFFPGFPGIGPGAVTVPHASEIAYAYGAAFQLAPGEEADLATPFAQYWLNFARHDDPNGGTLPHWPAYTTSGDYLMQLDVGVGGIRPQSGLRKEVCDYMDRRTVTEAQTLARVLQRI